MKIKNASNDTRHFLISDNYFANNKWLNKITQIKSTQPAMTGMKTPKIHPSKFLKVGFWKTAVTLTTTSVIQLMPGISKSKT